ncbi:hemin uptake protein HemP [Comamonas sp. Y33R10-2]|uniref:hemin uptake protein HemP n=1 Tax=Comamonas sp. Y33R10-2 TaxID=2853257 RepID=UPI001C5C9C39|nr:hemin uptake protein HemP [Comamonas sp. Y33R10-2]QXZ10587.1 hemin uptake protein HemP [Comamonas sp. Y33R10-2]
MSASLVATSQPSQLGATPMVAASSAAIENVHIGVDSAMLLNGQKAITIVHNGMPYRLQATKLGKLILTK